MKQKTNIDTLTDDQIRALESEAGSAGDLQTVEICRRALAGGQLHRISVVRMINDAEAQNDS